MGPREEGVWAQALGRTYVFKKCHGRAAMVIEGWVEKRRNNQGRNGVFGQKKKRGQMKLSSTKHFLSSRASSPKLCFLFYWDPTILSPLSLYFPTQLPDLPKLAPQSFTPNCAIAQVAEKDVISSFCWLEVSHACTEHEL